MITDQLTNTIYFSHMLGGFPIKNVVPNTYFANVTFNGNEFYSKSNATSKIVVNKQSYLQLIISYYFYLYIFLLCMIIVYYHIKFIINYTNFGHKKRKKHWNRQPKERIEGHETEVS